MATSNWSTSVLSGLSSDTEPTIVVTFESAKYIFNAGENTGRSWLQSRHHWKKAKALFFTSVGTQRMSGVPGLLMFFADGGIKNLNIVGPQGVLHSLAAMRLYTYRESLGVNPIEVAPSAPPTGDQVPTPTYTDQNITLYSIPIFPDPSASPNNPLKRKRELSPTSPSKRSLSSDSDPCHAINTPSSENCVTASLLERMRLPGFAPANLRDEEAQEWRKVTIEHMFPWKNPIPVALEQTAKKVKQKTSKGNAETEDPSSKSLSTVPYVSRKGPQSFNPGGCDKQLPRFSYTKETVPISPALRSTLAYVLVGPRVRGKFDNIKANALGLVGKLRGQVANGNSVTFMVNDGKGGQLERTVKPEDCVGPSENPGVVIVLDIPSPAHIPTLISAFMNSRFYSRFRQDDDHSEFCVNAVYHLCGDGVLEDERYGNFMRGFSTETHHIISSCQHNSDPVTFTSAAFNQLRLNKLDAEMFPLPKFNLNPVTELKDVPNLPRNISVLRSNTLIEMRPPRPPKLDPLVPEMDPFHAAASSTQFALPSHTLDKFAHTQSLVEKLKAKVTPKQPGHDVRILPLGTSSALPSKYRNVSGNLIRIPTWGNILLEAGEGTWGQLARYFGSSPDSEENVWKVLRDIKCIFVSHAHGDHHIGLAKILAMRKQLYPPPTEPLYLVTLHSIHVGLREMSDIEDLGIDYNPENNGVIPIYSNALHYQADPTSLTDAQRRSQTAVQSMCRALGLRQMSTVDVWHRTQCFGVVINHQDGWTIVFSGDTQPTDKLVEAGRNSTILIHEATMADDQAEMARAKAHSTVGQAIDIGKRMNAENILLTHFSARYPKMPPSIVKPPQQQPSEKEPTVGLAFDHTNLLLGEFWKLNLYLPAIEQSFSDTAEEVDDNQDKINIEW